MARYRTTPRRLALTRALLVAAGLLLGAANGPTWAQLRTVVPQERPQQQPLPDRNYRLRPGDEIEVVVDGFPELSRVGIILSDGTFLLPRVGAIPAQGLTVEELTRRVTEAMAKEIRNPRVGIAIRQIYAAPSQVGATVRVFGAVTKRGEVEITGPSPLRLILAHVEPTERADLSSVRVRYPDGTTRIVDFSRFGIFEDTVEDVVLKGGEEVIVLERSGLVRGDPIRVTVRGEVERPSAYQVDAGTTILEAVERAGGVTALADLRKVTIHGPAHPEPLHLDLEAIRTGAAPVYVMQSQDDVIIPQLPVKVYVFGEVANRQGVFAVRENTRLFEIYTQVGGANQNGDASRAHLIRRGADGKPVVQKINLNEAITKGRPEVNLVLQDNDVLFIPNRSRRRSLIDYIVAAGTASWNLLFLRNVGVF